MADVGKVTLNDFGQATMVIGLSRRLSFRVTIARGLLRLAAWVLKVGYREEDKCHISLVLPLGAESWVSEEDKCSLCAGRGVTTDG